MRKATYIEFEAGDPEPQIPYVLDCAGDRWERAEDGWRYNTPDIGRSWDRLMEGYGPLRAPEESFTEVVAALEAEAEKIRKRLAQIENTQAIFGQEKTEAPKVWRFDESFTEGFADPAVGTVLEDKDGDFWRVTPGNLLEFRGQNSETFGESDYSFGSALCVYGPLAEVPQSSVTGDLSDGPRMTWS